MVSSGDPVAPDGLDGRVDLPSATAAPHRQPAPPTIDGGHGTRTVITVEVEQALGPGIDFERDGRGDIVGRRVRPGGAWLGFDRAALVDSDDGRGRRLPVLVALPASTFVGARLEVELTGGLSFGDGPILIGRLPSGAAPIATLAGIAAGIDDGVTPLDRRAAEREAMRARQRYRERRSHARIAGGRAWDPFGSMPPEIARFTTPHSAAEYRLSRLPPRYLRGLKDLLDADERILYWVDRPARSDVGLVRRLRDRHDRRAALLALTDRQLLWIVDHAQPDRYLSDWGVDVELVPIERVTETHCALGGGWAEITVATPAGSRTYALPAEHEAEVGVMRDLVARFTPSAGGSAPRRRYALDAIPFDGEPAARFGQEAAARTLLERVGDGGDLLGFLFSPRRPGQHRPAAIALAPAAVTLMGHHGGQRVDLATVTAIRLTLSPLVGRLSFGPRVALSYPAPLADLGAAFVRLARRALANLS